MSERSDSSATASGNASQIRPLDSLYFFHIPKTAGTSIRHWLEDLFGRSEWLPCYILEEVEQLPRKQLERYRFFSGHFAWKIYDYLATAPPAITWLRDPLERVVSHYDFNRNRHAELVAIAARHGQQGWIDFYDRCRQLPLAELCWQEDFYGFNDNLQTRYLAGVVPHADRIVLQPADLQRAKENLARLAFVGICEWMPASMDALCHQLRCPPRPLLHHFNSRASHGAGTRTVLSPAERASLARCEAYDLDLYAFAQELFRKQMEALVRQAGCGDILAAEGDAWLTAYETQGPADDIRTFLREQFHAAPQAVEPPALQQVQFADATHLRGWYPRSLLPSGTVVRWAGPLPSASIYFPLRGGVDYELTFIIRYVLSYPILKTLRIVVDGQTFPLQSTPSPPDFGGKQQFLMTARIRAAAQSELPRWTEIQVVTDAPLQPFQHDPTQRASFATDGFLLREIPGSVSASPASLLPAA